MTTANKNKLDKIIKQNFDWQEYTIKDNGAGVDFIADNDVAALITASNLLEIFKQYYQVETWKLSCAQACGCFRDEYLLTVNY